jgi:hypothetical protein
MSNKRYRKDTTTPTTHCRKSSDKIKTITGATEHNAGGDGDEIDNDNDGDDSTVTCMKSMRMVISSISTLLARSMINGGSNGGYNE